MAANPKISLEQWRALLAVVDTGGYAQAAAALHKSQSAVTYAVQKMESLLGVKIFEVIGRKARLTATGEVLYRRARSLLDEAGALGGRGGESGGGLGAGAAPRGRDRLSDLAAAQLLQPLRRGPAGNAHRAARNRAQRHGRGASRAAGGSCRVLAGATRIHRRFSDPFTLHSGCPSEPSAAWARAGTHAAGPAQAPSSRHSRHGQPAPRRHVARRRTDLDGEPQSHLHSRRRDGTRFRLVSGRDGTRANSTAALSRRCRCAKARSASAISTWFSRIGIMQVRAHCEWRRSSAKLRCRAGRPRNHAPVERFGRPRLKAAAAPSPCTHRPPRSSN